MSEADRPSKTIEDDSSSSITISTCSRKRDLLQQQKHNGNGTRGTTRSGLTRHQQHRFETTTPSATTSEDHNTNFGEFLESPAKRFRNEEEDTMGGSNEGHDEPQFVIDTTLITGAAAKQNDESRPDDSGSVVSDCATEASSVAHLRGWLNEFGQQHKKHYETNASVGLAPPDAVKVTRARVARSNPELPPTPLPPASQAKLQRRVDSIPRARATPVRIRSRHSDVQATNDGYKSVAKLTAWLADDPTKKKEAVGSIRRGANVIAKSRAFDKGLAGVIVEQHNIRAGSVQDVSRRLESALDCPDETSSNISVSDKKAWLSNAFKKPDEARTELVTEKEKRDEATSRAKQMWRERSLSATKPRAPSSSSRAKQMWRERSASATKPRIPSAQKPLLPPSSPAPSSAQKKFVSRSPVVVHGAVEKENKVIDCVQNAPKENEEEREGAEKDIDFSEARKLLVQRSKENGHNVEVLTKVAMKKAKFERIEKDNRRRSSSHGQLKLHWDGVEGQANAYVKSFVANPSRRKSLEELP
mmetsp:Transcript_13353/g.29401  ORF Transcript_13353/g.29401 Transcript_13353/m.29401 type:complete len:530 (+) Transcript_13353:77-1666(+)